MSTSIALDIRRDRFLLDVVFEGGKDLLFGLDARHSPHIKHLNNAETSVVVKTVSQQ